MLNPDGVVLGNYRLSYSGADLNRKWKDTSKRLHKEVYEVKKRLLEWDKQGKIRMAIDIHGHSRKKGVFFYGCDVPGQHAAKVREFPYLMSSLHRSYCYQNCNFSTPKSK
jgi:murein tripeptide amidase MpaA